MYGVEIPSRVYSTCITKDSSTKTDHANKHILQSIVHNRTDQVTVHPLVICLLGNFQLMNGGQPVSLRRGGKTEALLSHLAIQQHHHVLRDTLLQALWPDGDTSLTSQSLHSLVHSLHKLVGDAIGGAPPVLHDEGYYRLNVEAGITVDIASFDMFANTGNCQYQTGNLVEAVNAYSRAAELYRGDLSTNVNEDIQALIERERLRARYLTLLARLADHYFSAGDYVACLDYAWRLLVRDPCREDAHRLVMRCKVRHGERSEALRHYRLCTDVLRAEFDAVPELATTALFEQIRHDPTGI